MSLKQKNEMQIQKGELFSAIVVTDIMLQIAHGIQTLHKAKRFHGNLKPSNVLLFNNGQEIIVKLSDFEGYPGNSNNYKSNKITYSTLLI